MLQNSNLSPSIKTIISVIAGILAAGIVIFLCESAMSVAFPFPESVNQQDMKSMSDYIKTSMPLAAFICLICSYAIGAFVGGFISVYMAKSLLLNAIIVGIALLIMTILNFVAIPHPMWVTVVACLVVPIFAWLGGRKALHGFVNQ
jgi:hypothetical protein